MGKPANFRIESVDAEKMVIRDLGPWDQHFSVTNDAAGVVARMVPLLGDDRRLFYYDSNGDLDEILLKDGRFVGFRVGPRAALAEKVLSLLERELQGGPKLVYTRQETAVALGISESSVDVMIQRRMIRPARKGRRVLIPRSEIERVASREIVGQIWPAKRDGKTTRRPGPSVAKGLSE
jgi:excisionase family DNA binding protein